MTLIHIHAPQPIEQGCALLYCPTCDRQRRFYTAYYEWYGSTNICTGCGDSWQDGELTERPFARGWRKQMIEHARKKLADIGLQA